MAAETCEFGELREALIKDHIVCREASGSLWAKIVEEDLILALNML